MSKTILVVDDAESLRTMVKSYLTQEGYRVVTAANGREALFVARQERPDLLDAGATRAACWLHAPWCAPAHPSVSTYLATGAPAWSPPRRPGAPQCRPCYLGMASILSFCS